jgi:hypothetical protein
MSIKQKVDKLLEVSFKSYAADQANIIAAVDTLKTSSESYDHDHQYEATLRALDKIRYKVGGGANKMVFDTYYKGIEDERMNLKMDDLISESIEQSEEAVLNLIPKYSTEGMNAILNELKSIAENNRAVLTETTNTKLDNQITRVQDIARLAEDFKKYDTMATKINAGADGVFGEQAVPGKGYFNAATGKFEGETYNDDYLTGEGIQLYDSPSSTGLQESLNRLARGDLKGAQEKYDSGEKAYVKGVWSDVGRSLSSVISRANSNVSDTYGNQKDKKRIPTEHLGSLDRQLLDQTRENVYNEIVTFVGDGLNSDDILSREWKNSSVDGLVSVVQYNINDRSEPGSNNYDPNFARKSDYEKILTIIKQADPNIRSGALDYDKHQFALASLIESMMEVNSAQRTIHNTLGFSNF